MSWARWEVKNNNRDQEHKRFGGLQESRRGKTCQSEEPGCRRSEKKTHSSVSRKWMLSIKTIWSFLTSARLKSDSALKVVFLTRVCSALDNRKSTESGPKHNNWWPLLCLFSLLSPRSLPCVFVDLRLALGPEPEKWFRAVCERTRTKEFWQYFQVQVQEGRTCGVIAHSSALFIYLFSPFAGTKAFGDGSLLS